MAVQDRNEVAEKAERFNKLLDQGCQCLGSASALLEQFWQCPRSVAGVYREAEQRDGSDAPAPMDVDAIEGLQMILRQAERMTFDLDDLSENDAGWRCRRLVRSAIDLLQASALAQDGMLTPAAAFGVGYLLDAASGELASAGLALSDPAEATAG